MKRGMDRPTSVELTAAFRHLSKSDALLISLLARLVDSPDQLARVIEERCPATHAYARKCHSDPYDSPMWCRTMALHAIDKLIGGHGMEPLGEVDMHIGPPYEYSNAGDPYVTTLIYDRDKDRLFIGCWGDVAENDPRLQSVDESEDDDDESEDGTDAEECAT